jgi:hypothetical protein
VARTFANTSQQLYRRNASGLFTGNYLPVTMSYWAKFTSFPAAAPYPVTLADTTTSWISPMVTAAGAAQAQHGSNGVGGGAASAIHLTPITTGIWWHICGVFLSNTSRTIYVNGINPVTAVADVGVSWTFDHLSLGAYYDGTIFASNWMNGVLAEVGLWNAALTAEEVLGLARGYIPPHIRPGNLVAWYPLIDPTVAGLQRDRWKNSYDVAESTSPPTVGEHPPIIYRS